MQVSELKKCLHERIEAEEDPLLLESLLDALELSRKDIFQIPDNWLPDISQGLKDIKEGNSANERSFNRNMKKWL